MTITSIIVGGGLADNDDGDEDVDKTLRTGGGEGRGPMEILFLITVLLGGWLGVVARLIIARWCSATTLMMRKYSHHLFNVISRMIIVG